MEGTKKMRLILSILFLTLWVKAQEAESLDGLSLPPEEKPAASATQNTDAIKSTTTPQTKPDLSLKKTKDNVGAILDFEGEVIEGERRRPDLFLQISIDNVKFDSLIYNRDDFNDYLEVDRKSRNKFFKMK